MDLKKLNEELRKFLEEEQEYDNDKDIIERYKGFEIFYNAKERSVHIQNPKYGESAEVIAQTSNYTADNLMKAAKNIIDRGNVDLRWKRIFESNEEATYCVNLYDAGEGKEMEFIGRVEGFKTKEDAEKFANKNMEIKKIERTK